MEQKNSKAGAFYLIGVGFFVALVGAVFMWLMWRSFAHASATRDWKKTPAVMVVSAMNTRSDEHISKEYQWQLEYTYEIDGKAYSSKLHGPRGSKWTSRKKEVQALIDEYPVNATVEAFVNPDKPELAILEHDTKAAGYSIWFPALFVVGGCGMMVGAARKLRK